MKLRTTPHLQNGVICEKIFHIVLYPDSTAYDCKHVLSLVYNMGCDYAVILHDRDKEKKPHYHAVLRFNHVRSLNALSNDLGILSSAVEWKSSFKDSVRYLTHMKYPNKYQYPVSSLITNLSDSQLEKIFQLDKEDKEEEESNSVLAILDYMESGKPRCYRDVMRWACKNKMYSFLRRSGSHLMRCFDEIQIEKQSLEYREKLKKRYEEQKITKENTSANGFTPVSDEQLEF